MSIPAGHLLGPRQRHGHRYLSTCACGLDVWATSLPRLFAAHDLHLAVVKSMSMRRHPGWRP